MSYRGMVLIRFRGRHSKGAHEREHGTIGAARRRVYAFRQETVGETSGDFLRLPSLESTQNAPTISCSSILLREPFFWKLRLMGLLNWRRGSSGREVLTMGRVNICHSPYTYRLEGLAVAIPWGV